MEMDRLELFISYKVTNHVRILNKMTEKEEEDLKKVLKNGERVLLQRL